MRFRHSHSLHQAFGSCRAKFLLLQNRTPRTADATNLLFGKTFHLFAQKYRDHCIEAKRWSDVEIVGDLVDQTFRETGLSLSHYEAMTHLCRKHVANEPIDIERSLMREGGIALDENLELLPWRPEYEYDAKVFAHSFVECDDCRPDECFHFNGDVPTCSECGLQADDPMHRLFLRMQLDEILVDAPTRLLLIDDWKTDYAIPSASDVQNPELRWWKQAMEYAWGAANYLYPDALAVEFRFKFVRWSVTRTLLITREEIDAFAETFLRRIRFVEEAEHFQATPGEHCRMCPFLGGACPIPQGTAQYATDTEAMAAEYVYAEAIREAKRDALKAVANEDGTVMVGGLPVLIFEKTEHRVMDVRKVLEALESEGIENPAYLLDVSPSKLKEVLDADQLERVMAKASEPAEAEVVFNVHQNKPELLKLAESLGVQIDDPKKIKKAQLALAIASAARPQKAA